MTTPGPTILEYPPKVEYFTVKNYTSAAFGDVVGKTHDALVAAKTEQPTCILADFPSTKFPQRNLQGLGEAALLNMNGATAWPGAQSPGTIIYSAGDGTMTVTKPTTGTAGQTCYEVGVVEKDLTGASTSDNLRIRIRPIRVEA